MRILLDGCLFISGIHTTAVRRESPSLWPRRAVCRGGMYTAEDMVVLFYRLYQHVCCTEIGRYVALPCGCKRVGGKGRFFLTFPAPNGTVFMNTPLSLRQINSSDIALMRFLGSMNACERSFGQRELPSWSWLGTGNLSHRWQPLHPVLHTLFSGALETTQTKRHDSRKGPLMYGVLQ